MVFRYFEEFYLYQIIHLNFRDIVSKSITNILEFVLLSKTLLRLYAIVDLPLPFTPLMAITSCFWHSLTITFCSSKSHNVIVATQQDLDIEENKNKYVFADNGLKTDFSGKIGKSILLNKDKITSFEQKNKYLFKHSYANTQKSSGIIGKKFALSVK